MSKRRPTISDVARNAGVSEATVSAVLNDKDTVADATRRRVASIIEELNYRPRYVGGHPGPNAQRSVGLLIKEMDNPYYAEVACGVSEWARDKGYVVLVTSSQGDGEAERKSIEVLRSQGVMGLVVTPVMHADSDTDLSHLFELKRRNFPFVLLERIRGLKATMVDVENVEGSRTAVEFLFRQGHKRIVHFAGPTYSMHSEERIDGVRRAFSRTSLVFPEDAIIRVGAEAEDGYEMGLRYFQDRRGDDRPTAVTCYNDLVALGVYRALRELGLDVPGDVSVVGFDDLGILPYTDVPLTTVRVPKVEMGRRAAELLIERMESNERLPPETVFLEAELIVRASTRAI